eukprot:MONOS_1584.1-p1 / transcript=MONOS_1584.1 / gene=MONOS_1584 / organism=Monocercomonoides_exilis_PA203 / gene_product=Similar to Protein transport protein yif1 / transcript_product=Similar to Protein transport protein yif1 / location=Mono_scaffold00028:120572-121925(+) / protein_length=328 / sequence_SO=supercontig / SO=protein_coding / is_pseudo=false
MSDDSFSTAPPFFGHRSRSSGFSESLPHDPNSAFTRPTASYSNSFPEPSSSRTSQSSSTNMFNVMGSLGHAALPQFFGGASGEAFFQTATSTLQSQTERAKKDVNSRLRPYFAVNNTFVINKLKILSFPFLKKDWSRKKVHVDGNPYGSPASANDNTIYSHPRDDINSPDLYIPLTATLTFVLVIALFYGIQSQFHPEVILQVGGTCIGTIILESILNLFISYLFSSSFTWSILGTLDVVANTSYIFVGLALGVLLFLLKKELSFLVLGYYLSAYCYFMYKTSLSQMRDDRAEASNNKRQHLGALIIAAVQVPGALLTLFFSLPHSHN